MIRSSMLCALLLVTSCGSAEPAQHGDVASGGETTSDAECTLGERRMTEAQVCECVTPRHCGGARPSPDLLERLSQQIVWQCRPRASAACEAVLTSEVVEGTPCPEEGETCQTDSCCADTIRCVEGSWRSEAGSCPP